MPSPEPSPAKKTVPTDFPIPYPGQQPGEDLDRAVKMLELVREVLSEGGIFGTDYATMLTVVLSDALDILAPIARLLDHADRADDGELYLRCRRADIVAKMGNGGAE